MSKTGTSPMAEAIKAVEATIKALDESSDENFDDVLKARVKKLFEHKETCIKSLTKGVNDLASRELEVYRLIVDACDKEMTVILNSLRSLATPPAPPTEDDVESEEDATEDSPESDDDDDE